MTLAVLFASKHASMYFSLQKFYFQENVNSQIQKSPSWKWPKLNVSGRFDRNITTLANLYIQIDRNVHVLHKIHEF